MKISLEKYLLHSSVFIVFSEAFFINYGIDWKLMYLLMFLNYLIILKVYSFKLHKNFLYLLLFLLVHASICYILILIPPNYFISQILGIAISSLYFYNIFRILNITKIKNTYLEYSFYAAIIGYIFYFTGFNLLAYFKHETRLMSLFKEPAHYVVVVIPACYFYLRNKSIFRFLVLFISILLSESSLGYIGCGLMFVLPYINFNKLKYFFILAPIVATVFLYTYKEVESFKMRIDDSASNLMVLRNGKFEENTNLSSYVLLSNLYIAKQNFLEHPLGSGIGSHHYMYTTRYYKTMRPPEYLKTLGHDKDNSFDANSLFTRLFSEFGWIGLTFIFVSLVFLFKSLKTSNYILHGLTIYFILKLFRDGTYFPPEFFFFIWLFLFEFRQLKNE